MSDFYFKEFVFGMNDLINWIYFLLITCLVNNSGYKDVISLFCANDYRLISFN